ncbi:head GIN domain-containing protein [Georgenia yuyongxinii]|nr:head GIN domain-containing protein [Georgenia yuyongxinii]
MTLRKLAWIALAIAPPLTLAGCGAALDAGPATTEERTIEDVSAVSLAGAGNVNLTTGAEPSLTVTAGENIIDRVTSTVRDGVLRLDVDGPVYGSPGEITYDLVLPSVDEIRIDGAGDVDAQLTSGETLEVDLSGAGDVRATGVDVTSLTVRVGGVGGVHLSGTADRQTVVISGLGDYDGVSLTSADADVTIGGAGDAQVHATDTLNASVDGAGSIVHTGGARVTSSIDGVGNIRQG